jgi:hypothetical protein
MPNQALQKEVRATMNKLFGIEHDKDALCIPSPPQDDFDWYEDNGGDQDPLYTPCHLTGAISIANGTTDYMNCSLLIWKHQPPMAVDTP